MQEIKLKSNWDKEANSGLKENNRGNYLSGLFIKAVDNGIIYLPKEKEKISLLKTDLWNEGADFKKNVLGNYANEKFNLFGIDLSTEVIKALKVGAVKPVQANISALPFKDSSIDILLDLSTIDHVPFLDAENIISQYQRVLKHHGVLVLVFDAWGLLWKLYFLYLKNFRNREVGVFSRSEVKNQYIFSPKEMLKSLKICRFDILEEFSIDWFGWAWNRLTFRFLKNFQELNPNKLINLEYSRFSKYLKILAKQYVIIAKNDK